MAEDPSFRIDKRDEGARRTLELAGELDSASCDQLMAEFDAALAEAHVREMLLDLQEVTFIDSAGMRTLVGVEAKATEHGFRLRVLPAPDSVTALLQSTGVASHLDFGARADELPREPIERVELKLPAQATSPRTARSELREALSEHLNDGDLSVAVLLTSELVTNAVIHPPQREGARIGVAITSYRDGVRVEVIDCGSGFDPDAISHMVADRSPERLAGGGRGLSVVHGLASRWGAAPLAGDSGFRVWFELDLEDDPRELATA